MGELFDAVVLAGGRFSALAARRAGTHIKALMSVGGVTLLQQVIAALRAVPKVANVVVVAPDAARPYAAAAHQILSERVRGEDNVIAGLQAAQSRRVLLCASDLPFVQSSHISDFIERVPADADFAYAIIEREVFLAAFPGGRTKFARADGRAWTGGSATVIARDLAQRKRRLVRHAFEARRNMAALACLFGPGVLVRHLRGTLRVGDIERRLSQIVGGRAVAVLGCDPALAMDCDSSQDVAFVQAWQRSSRRVATER